MSVSIPMDIPIWKMKKEVGEENSVDTATVLTGFVREKYLKHLKTLLIKNYTTCSLHQESLQVFTEQDIEKCAKDLENEALRECMVVQLYQKSMSSMVKDIKKHTDLFKLHNTLEKFTSTSTNKETQTETVTPTIEKIQPQPLPDLIGRFEKSDSTGTEHRSSMESSEEHQTIKQEPGLDSLECDVRAVKQELPLEDDSSNICTPSRTNVEPISTILKRQITAMSHTCTGTKVPKLEPNLPCQQNNNEHSKSPINDSEYPSLDERLADLLRGDNSLSLDSNLELEEPHPLPIPDFNELDFPYLDERLAEIFGETSELEPEVKRKRFIKKVTSWSLEKEINLRMLNSLMTRFSKTKKLHVERLFYELFELRRRRKRKEGLPVHTNSVVVGSTGNNLISEKKRLGRRVVQQLMQFYKNGQISSREQFKSTASQITDGLVLKNTIPEDREIEESIMDFFLKNRTTKK